MQWTHEQSPIIQSKHRRSWCEPSPALARHHPGGLPRRHYPENPLLCYNSSVEKARRASFPATLCARRHSRSSGYGIQYAHKKTKNLRLTIRPRTRYPRLGLVRDVLATLNNTWLRLTRNSAPHIPALPRQGVPHQCQNASSSRAWTWRE